MRFLLSSHPNIAFSRRTNLWTRYYNRYGDLAREANFERCLNALLQSKHVQFLNPDPARIRREFWQGEMTYARLFALLHEHYAEQQGKVRWGDQTELIEGRAELVLAAYPDAKIIHLIRDPRDRYEAWASRFLTRRSGVGSATAQWLYSVRLAERNQQHYPERYLVVRYESLVTRPEETVALVCAFLGETYMPEMLLMKDVPRFKSLSSAGRSPITTEHIGRYRRSVPARELAFMQMMAGREMLAYGYSLDRLDISLADRLFLMLFEWPSDLIHAVAWRSLVANHP